MAAIVNYRDVLLQAASPRVLPVPIPEEIKAQLRRLKINASATTVTEDGATTTPATITLTAVKEGTLAGAVTWSATGATVTGSGDTVSVAGTSIADAGATVTASVTQDGKTYTAQINLAKTKVPKGLRIESSGMTFIGRSSPTTPSTITLTAVRSGGLTGAVTWSVFAGSATLTPSGDTCTVTGSTVSGYSVTIKATVGTYSATIALTRLGELSAQEKVDLTSMVTGQLASGNVSGLGALALLNTVSLNPAPGSPVTVIGTLAADRVGIGTLAVGVQYAGQINASQIDAGSFSGKTFTGGEFVGTVFKTASSGERIELSGTTLTSYNSSGGVTSKINDAGRSAFYGRGSSSGMEVLSYNSKPAIFCQATSSGPALSVDGPLKLGATTWANPPTLAASDKYMRADGQWRNPADDNYLRGANVSGSAGALAGYIVLTNGYKIPYHNP